jgi:hypothetical protein
VAAIAIVLLAFAAAFTVALAHQCDREDWRGCTDNQAVGCVVLVVVGVWFIALGVFAEFFASVFPV